MAIYKTSELLNQLCKITSGGFEYVEIFEIEGDGEDPAALSFEGVIDERAATGFDDVESCQLPPNYNLDNPYTRKITPQEYCGDLPFTYQEIFSLGNAVNYALEYCKECSKDPVNKDILSELKEDMVDLRNLQAKFAKYLKKFKFK